jgi:hypothetical protein
VVAVKLRVAGAGTSRGARDVMRDPVGVQNANLLQVEDVSFMAVEMVRTASVGRSLNCCMLDLSK